MLIIGCQSPKSMEVETPPSSISPNLQENLQSHSIENESASVDMPPDTASYQRRHELYLENTMLINIDTDGEYIYWSGGEENCCIWRRPLQGERQESKAELVAYTLYKDVEPKDIYGPLSVDHGAIAEISIEEDWLVFRDTKYASLYSPFFLRALNLRTGVEKIIESDQRPGAGDPIFALDGSRVVFARLTEREDGTCDADSILVVYDLETDERQELDRVCPDDNYMWNFTSGIDISDNFVVAIQMFSDAQGSEKKIVLFNLENGESRIISGENKFSSGPAISGKWAAWKVYPDDGDVGPGNGLGTPDYTVLMNLETGEIREIHHTYGMDEPLLENGRWLYWDDRSEDPWLTAYDLNSGDVYTITVQAPGWYKGHWKIRGNTIAWYVWNAVQPDQEYLRWKTGADPSLLIRDENRPSQ